MFMSGDIKSEIKKHIPHLQTCHGRIDFHIKKG